MAREKAKAEHSLIGVDGVVVDDIAAATGIRYIDLETREVVDAQVASFDPKGILLLALFGAKTKATNTASQCRQRGESGAEQVASIRGDFATIAIGQWPEREGGGGGRVNVDALAVAFVDLQVKARKVAKDQHDVVLPGVREKLAQKPVEDLRKMLMVPGMRDAYNRALGKEAASLSDFEDLL